MTTFDAPNTDPSQHKHLLAAGILYLLTFVSIPTLSLYGAIHGAGYIAGAGPDTPVLVGALLELVVGVACIGSAVALYPVLKRHGQALAVGLLGARVLEAGTIFAGVAALLTIVSMRQSGVGAEALPVGQALVTLYDRFFLIGQSFMPVFNDVLLGILLYRSRLVPRGLALLGVLGAAPLLISDLTVLFGMVPQRHFSAGLAAIPVALFEFSLGIVLVVKGVRAARAAAMQP